jgi:hypothetical protein
MTFHRMALQKGTDLPTESPMIQTRDIEEKKDE